MKVSKRTSRIRRHRRVRNTVHGTAGRPRVCIFRSNRHLHAQVVDDDAHRTLAAATTVSKDSAKKNSANCETAQAVGKRLGEKIKELGIERVVFDRGGHIYHGVVKSFAEGLRSADEANHFHF